MEKVSLTNLVGFIATELIAVITAKNFILQRYTIWKFGARFPAMLQYLYRLLAYS